MTVWVKLIGCMTNGGTMDELEQLDRLNSYIKLEESHIKSAKDFFENMGWTSYLQKKFRRDWIISTKAKKRFQERKVNLLTKMLEDAKEEK